MTAKQEEKNMRHLPLWVTVVAVTLAATWTFAQAQEKPPSPGAPGVQAPPQQSPPDGKALKHQGARMGKDGSQAKAREMLEQVMIARLSSELKLNDEQSMMLMRRFTEARAEKQALGKERSEALHALRDIVDQNKDEAALNERLARLRDIDTKLASHKQRLQETMGADLSPWQKGKLVLFLDQFETDIKQMLRDAHERRNNRPMNPMGMPPAPGMMPPGMRPDMQPGMRPGMPPDGMQPGMHPPRDGHGPMPPGGPNGPAGMRPQDPPQGPPEAPPQGPPPQAPAK
jgi:hypothetical protein